MFFKDLLFFQLGFIFIHQNTRVYHTRQNFTIFPKLGKTCADVTHVDENAKMLQEKKGLVNSTYSDHNT